MTVLVERRRAPFGRPLLLRVLAGWLVVSALLLAVNWPGIAGERFVGPDDMLRMQQVRDLIGGQNWFDVTQHRLDAPHGGVPMHWSRLVDVPILLVILLMKPLVGMATAEVIAGVAVPLLTLLCLMVLVARVAWFLLGEEETSLAVLAIPLSTGLLFQFSPMRIDHHAWQVVFGLAAVNGLMSRSARTGGTVIGLSLAAGLAISMEELPIAAVFCGLLALRWLRDRKDRLWLVHAMQALALGSVVLFLATRGFGDGIQHCDAISPLHLLVFLWGALALTGLAARNPPSVLLLASAFAGIAAGAVGIVRVMAPSCVGDGFSQVDPLVQDVWFSQIREGMPVYLGAWHQQVTALLIPVLGLAAAALLMTRSVGWMRSWWFDYALLLLAAILVAVFVKRAGAMAGALAAIPFGWMLARMLARTRLVRNPLARAGALAALVLLLMPLTPRVIDSLLPTRAKGANSVSAATPLRDDSSIIALRPPDPCGIASAAPSLDALPPGETLALIDPSTPLVFYTHRAFVASSHHRGDRAMRFAIEAFSASPQVARRMLSERGVRYVSICSGSNEIEIYRKRNPKGFAVALDKGETLDWLEPVSIETAGTLRMWKVVAAGDHAALKSSATPLMQ
ncbi:MAG: hypothetical protein WC692_09505 [Erythrobacter sp.]